MTEPSNLDVKKLSDSMSLALRGVTTELFQGAQADLVRFSDLVGGDMALAVSAGRADLVEEIKMQVDLLLEANRLRARHGQDQVAITVLGSVVQALVGSAVGALGAAL